MHEYFDCGAYARSAHYALKRFTHIEKSDFFETQDQFVIVRGFGNAAQINAKTFIVQRKIEDSTRRYKVDEDNKKFLWLNIIYIAVITKTIVQHLHFFFYFELSAVVVGDCSLFTIILNSLKYETRTHVSQLENIWMQITSTRLYAMCTLIF